MRYFSIFISLFFAANVQAQSIPSYLPTSGLVAWYPFNGNANDGSGNGNDATNYGASLTTDRNGNANGAYLFDGNSNYMQLPMRQVSITQWSVSAWLKTDTGGVIIQGGNFGPYPDVGITNRINKTDGGFAHGAEIRADGYGYQSGVQGTSNLADNIWHHYVGVWSGTYGALMDSTQLSIYIDGVLVSAVYSTSVGHGGYSTDSRHNAPFSPSSNMIIGKHTSWGQYFSGKLDDIAIYNRALSASEVTSIYNGGSTSISGASTVCLTTPSTYTSSTTGGTWSVIPSSIGTISASGLFTPSRAGGAIIRYNVGTTHTDFPVTVYPNTAPTTSGDLNVCVGGTTGAYSAYIAGIGNPTTGSWSSSNPSIASIDVSTKRASGVSGGTAVLTYSITDACGTFNSTRNLQVASTPPNAGRLTGSSSVVLGNSIVISQSSGSVAGAWSTSAASIASIGTITHATLSTTATVTGVTAGTATITYTVTNACGSNRVTKTISVTSPREAWAQESGVKMYPNPTTGMLNIEYARLTTNLEIEMVDMTGKVVYAQATEFEKMSIDVSKFITGTYLVRIKANGEQSQQRVVVE